jgi:hypothetical protein
MSLAKNLGGGYGLGKTFREGGKSPNMFENPERSKKKFWKNVIFWPKSQNFR